MVISLKDMSAKILYISIAVSVDEAWNQIIRVLADNRADS